MTRLLEKLPSISETHNNTSNDLGAVHCNIEKVNFPLPDKENSTIESVRNKPPGTYISRECARRGRPRGYRPSEASRTKASESMALVRTGTRPSVHTVSFERVVPSHRNGCKVRSAYSCTLRLAEYQELTLQQLAWLLYWEYL